MTALFLSLSPSSQFFRSPLLLAREVAEPGPRGERPSPPHSSLPPLPPAPAREGKRFARPGAGGEASGTGGGRSSGFEASRLRPSASSDGRPLRLVPSPGRVLPEAAAERASERASDREPGPRPSFPCAAPPTPVPRAATARRRGSSLARCASALRAYPAVLGGRAATAAAAAEGA